MSDLRSRVPAGFTPLSRSPATTYYVDPENGDPQAGGFSPDQPAREVADSWKHPGATLLYRRGTTVRGGLPQCSGTPEAWVTIGAYGEGAKPVFTKSTDLRNPELWGPVGDSVWRCTLRLPDCANIIYNHEAFCGAKRWLKQDLAWPGDWFCEGDELLVYSHGNPGHAFQAVEFVPSETFITFGKDDAYVAVEDVHIKNAGIHGFWFNGGHHIVLRRCDVSYMGGAVFPSTLGVPEGLTVRYGNGIEVWREGHHIMVEGCRVFETYDGAICLQGLKGDRIHDISVRGCTLWNNSFDSFDCSWGVVATNVSFENNTCLAAGAGWGIKTEGRPRLSAFLPDAVGWHVFLTHSSEPSAITIRNNIFFEAPANPIMKFNCSAESMRRLVLDCNCYYQPDPRHPLVHYAGELYRIEDFGRYRAASGFDRHSIVADPLFLDPSRRDYRLQPHSPCRGAGVHPREMAALPGMPPSRFASSDIGAPAEAP